VFAYNHADWYVDSVLMRGPADRRPSFQSGRARSQA
jgi:hypothetical protein